MEQIRFRKRHTQFLYIHILFQILVNVSAAALEHGIYVVINTEEVVDCTSNPVGEDCPEAKRYLFNTNVVFDRSGAIIDR